MSGFFVSAVAGVLAATWVRDLARIERDLDATLRDLEDVLTAFVVDFAEAFAVAAIMLD